MKSGIFPNSFELLVKAVLWVLAATAYILWLRVDGQLPPCLP